MDKIIAIHISNNNGKQDQHKSLTKDCWQVKTLKNFRNCPIILETMNLTTEKIISNINIVKNTIKNQKYQRISYQKTFTSNKRARSLRNPPI